MSTEKVIYALSRLGIATLVDVFGDERLQRLADLGVPMRPKTISEAAFQEVGFDVFKSKKLRLSVLNSLSETEIRKAFNTTGNLDLEKAAQFQWGPNTRTESFLALFDLGLDDAFTSSEEIVGFKSSSDIAKPLFDYQNSIRKQLIAFLQGQNNKRIIAHMPTGSGKTRTTMELVSDFIRNYNSEGPILVVWMAHSDELCEQAAQTFQTTWDKLGSENAGIYRLWGGRQSEEIDFTKPAFLITSFQSCYAAMMSRRNAKFRTMSKLRNECDLLIVDEAHMSTAPTYKAAIEFLCNEKTQIIGLTATPGRHHVGGESDQTEELSSFYENNKITLGDEITAGQSPIEFLQNRGILSTVDRYPLPSGVDIKLSPKQIRAVSELLELPADILRELGDNATRTSLIASHALLLAVEQKKQTIIFCPTKENASNLAALLRNKGCSARAITGETPMKNRRQWIEDFKSGDLKVLTNFGVLTTGFDAPNIEAVIVARPTTSVVLYSQMVGRGLRGDAVGGSAACTLVDVVDNIENLPEIPQAFTYFDEFFGDKNANC